MIRILNVFGSLNRGGSETMAMNYYRKIDSSKIQFDFVVHSVEEGAYENEIRELGGRVFRVRRFKGYNILSYIQDWRKLLSSHPEWEIIHCHLFTIAGYIFAFACSDFKKKIVHSHIANAKFSFVQKVAFAINKFLIKRYATKFMACGDEAGKFLYDEKPFQIIANAIDSDKFRYNQEQSVCKRKELGLKDYFVIGHIGRFSKQKNHTFLIDIFCEIHKQDTNTRLLLIGKGPLESAIKDKISDCGLSDFVVFTGERSDVPELMMAIDVFVLPSLYEGLGIVAIEAQTSGLPTIISNNVPDAAKITCLATSISLKRNSHEWADEILKWSKGYVRNDMSQAIKDAGYDVNNNIKILENLYLL